MNRITAIEKKKGKSSRLSIHVDEQHCLDCSAELAAQYGLRVGDLLPPEQLRQLQHADELAQAKRDAVRLLGHRARTEKDLKKRLQHKRKFADHIIDETIAWLTDHGYLDDSRYAIDRVNSLLGRTKMGHNGLEARLVAEGVDRQLARQVTDETVSPDDEQKWACQLARERAQQLQGKPWETVKRSICGYLTRRGFDSDHVWTAIRDIEPEQEMP